MDGLSKDQADELATAMAILALYDGGADITTDQVSALLDATGNKQVEAFYPIIFCNFVSSPDKLAQLIALPSGGGGGGGGGGGAGGGGEGAAEEEEEKEEEVEEEADIGGGGMFGDDGGGGDY